MNERSTCPHTIVLVEDDPNVSLMLTRHFERAGWSVIQTGSIAAARQTLEESRWDLVLLDRALPDGNGVELCSAIRDKWPHAYIMMLTGAGTEAEKIEGFACGADDYVTKPFNMDELIARVRASLRIVDLQKALIESNRRLEEMSLTDELTGLRNRRAFDREISSRFGAAMRYSRPLAVAVIDVDHFKPVNDNFGHQEGDTVLHDIAAILRRTTRASDFVARYGGEEFAVILPETALFEAIQFGEKIRAGVAASDIAGHRITVSVGVASIPHSLVTSPEEFLYCADQALYRAKQGGRNRVESEKRRERYARRSARPSEQSTVAM